MRPTQCVVGLYLTLADLLAPLPINNNNNKIFRRFPAAENKKGLRKFSARFLAFSNKISMVQEIVLSSSQGQGNFRGLEASRPRPRTSKCVLEDSISDFCKKMQNFRTLGAPPLNPRSSGGWGLRS